MPTIEIVTVGRVKSGWIRDGAAHYSKLLSRYRRVESTTVKENSGSSDATEVVRTESARIEERLVASKCNIILDVGGREFDSLALAGHLAEMENNGKPLQFLVGGAHGLSQDVKTKADLLLSLSKLTLPHELTMLVLLEQLYRAYSILAGAKYHK